MNINLHCANPYPIPEKLPRNIRWARILLGIYSGRDSELTYVTQYLYHSIVTKQSMPELSEHLLFIAMQEMEHLELLGVTINLLGLRPSYTFYQGTRRLRWNTGFVQYRHNPREILEVSLAGKHKLIEDCEYIIRCIPEEQIQALLRRIIEDEKQHADLLTGLQGSL